MPASLGSRSAPRRRFERLAPVVVVVLVAILAGLSIGTGWLVIRHFGEDAAATSRLYSEVFSGLNSPKAGAETDALLALGDQVRRLGMPLVVTDASNRVTAYDNLPFEPTSIDDERLQSFVQRLDRENPPISDSLIGTVHYGAMPARFHLTALVVLQAFTIAVMVGVAVFAYRSAISAQRDRLWVAMAREAAHQMGTPLTSLQGWIERIRSLPGQPPQLAEHLAADAERLDRVARRFERIGNPAAREPIGLGALADRVAGYFRPRLPKWANQIDLRVEAAGAGPTVLGDPVLLEWALEALVKNAIDALQGRPGTIILRVESDQRTAAIRVLDDGPGVPKEIRREIFEPGITTKRGGWGIGLALSRRVVEEAHHGELTLESVDKGTCFLIRIPLAEAAA
ncbi:MAG TPA: HAMP domain-containing sensor histidine kinase [Gemmatimonadales bacterium]|jgi:signal transduction histidine kinase|nr:HAMP domain-containing sensor histidine kinase [Gemmatimonadales bacterium]